MASAANVSKHADLSLETWVQDKFFSDSSMSTVDLGQFGLNNAQQVVAFLKSPAGKVLESEAMMQAELQTAMLEEQQRLVIQHNVLMERLKALLFLWYTEDKSFEQHNQQLEIIAQQNASLHQGAQHATPKSHQDNLQYSLNDYDAAIKELTQQRLETQAEMEQIDLEALEIDEKKQLLTDKYAVIDEVLADAELLDNQPLDEEASESMIQRLHDKISPFHSASDELSQQSEASSSEILLNEISLLIRGVSAVPRNERYLVNELGEEVQSFKDAAFVLRKDHPTYKKMVQMDGQSYLLQEGQDWNSIKDNQQQRDEARQLFVSNRPVLGLLSIRNLAEHHQAREFMPINMQATALKTRRDENLQRGQLINQSLQNLNLERNNIINQLNALQKPSASPTPNMTPAKTATPQVQNNVVTQQTKQYKEELNNLKNKGQVTSDDIYTLANHAPLNMRPNIQNYLRHRLPKDKLAANITLSPNDKQAILQQMYQLGTPADSVKEKAQVSYTPTPFDNKPSPY
ncbi:MAG: hypothetical protein H0U75_03185 [Legionella sp.]|nr:hypothetical protein [Legionella sp.]